MKLTVGQTKIDVGDVVSEVGENDIVGDTDLVGCDVDSVGKGVIGCEVVVGGWYVGDGVVGSFVTLVNVAEPETYGIEKDVISPSPNSPPCTIRFPSDVML